MKSSIGYYKKTSIISPSLIRMFLLNETQWPGRLFSEWKVSGCHPRTLTGKEKKPSFPEKYPDLFHLSEAGTGSLSRQVLVTPPSRATLSLNMLHFISFYFILSYLILFSKSCYYKLVYTHMVGKENSRLTKKDTTILLQFYWLSTLPRTFYKLFQTFF